MFALPPRWRWLAPAAMAAGGGGTTVTVLLQEEAELLEIFGPVGAIPLIGMPVLWFMRAIFNQAAPPSDRSGRS
jgi:hypothetical protein